MTTSRAKRVDRCPLCSRPVEFSLGRAVCHHCRVDIAIWFHRFGGNPYLPKPLTVKVRKRCR